MENFEKVKNIVENNNCVLLTSFEDFEERRKTVLNKCYHFVKINIIASCYHNTEVIFTNFKLRKTGIKCKECMRKNSCDMVKNIDFMEIEYEGIRLVTENLSNYIVKRLKEGCRADIAIKSIENKDDIWIPLQIKTIRKQSHSMYSFNINKNYENMILILVCLCDKKVWVIPYNDVEGIVKINISRKSKYDKYYVDNNPNLGIFIEKFLNKVKMLDLNVLDTPISKYQKRENEYIIKREKYVNFLHYEYPQIQGNIFDFLINNKKIQEKVLGFGDRGLVCNSLSHNCGKLNNKRNIIPYNKRDNDYYWFHSTIDDRFWIIPENVLIYNKYIGDSIKRKRLTFNLDWLKKYEYNYNSINPDDIKNIFYS
jgi:hypothetical protein